MSYIATTLSNLIQQTAFFGLSWGNYLMIAIALVFMYLAIKKGYEPLLLIPISFGMLLVNMYPDIMLKIEDSSNGVGGLLSYFYLLDDWSILPSLIFLGVGAMTDFSPLIANPISFLMGAAAQFGIYIAYIMAVLMGFPDKAAAAISIIGGADGPTSIPGPDCRCGIFLYVTRADHPAADHEAVHHGRGEKDPHGSASSGQPA